MTDEPKGRCPNCGGPLINVRNFACCLRSPDCSKLQEKLPSRLNAANTRELILANLTIAEIAGTAKDCKPHWYTKKIYQIPDAPGFFRRQARGPRPLKGSWRRWVAVGGKIIEVAGYEPRDGDKMLPASKGGEK